MNDTTSEQANTILEENERLLRAVGDNNKRIDMHRQEMGENNHRLSDIAQRVAAIHARIGTLEFEDALLELATQLKIGKNELKAQLSGDFLEGMRASFDEKVASFKAQLWEQGKLFGTALIERQEKDGYRERDFVKGNIEALKVIENVSRVSDKLYGSHKYSPSSDG